MVPEVLLRVIKMVKEERHPYWEGRNSLCPQGIVPKLLLWSRWGRRVAWILWKLCQRKPLFWIDVWTETRRMRTDTWTAKNRAFQTLLLQVGVLSHAERRYELDHFLLIFFKHLFFFLFFGLHCRGCGILVSLPGIQSQSLHWSRQS